MWMRMGRRGMGLFDGVVGQPLATAILTNALDKGAAHAYLLAGPRGVGKTEAALAFAAALLCPEHGCDCCEACRRARAGVHLDLDIWPPRVASSGSTRYGKSGRTLRTDPLRRRSGCI